MQNRDPVNVAPTPRTPGEWRQDPVEPHLVCVFPPPQEMHALLPIVVAVGRGRTREEALANAAALTSAVNVLDDLLIACEQYLTAVDAPPEEWHQRPQKIALATSAIRSIVATAAARKEGAPRA